MLKQKIGILGGGQLGRMLLEASIPLNFDLSILDENSEYPAANICQNFYEGSFANYEDVMQFGLAMDIITVEIESVNVAALISLEQHGKKVFPQSHVLETINDKGLQKMFFTNNNLPTANYLFFENKEEVILAIESKVITFPFVQKIRTGGYDGKGVSIVRSSEDLDIIFDAPCIVEENIDIQKELSVIVCRDEKGNVAAYPPVEMDFHPTANLVEFLFCPAEISKDLHEKAVEISRSLSEKLNIVGLLAVEMFLDTKGEILINEIAPRPHNSGHHTIEANYTSQFEQHLRAISGLPLGSTELIMPAVMINLLGEEGYKGLAQYDGLEQVISQQGVYVHLYNKKMTSPKRKMGHITIIDTDINIAKEKASKIKEILKVTSKDNL
ncbi:MAG: hypothetical protein RLZZ546_2119 [Bacteroidota bacterium]